MFLKRLDLQSVADQDLAIGVLQRSPAYSLECFGCLPTRELAEKLLKSRPEACGDEQIIWCAAFEHEKVLGLVQVAQHFPNEQSAIILMLVVDPAHQRRHVGCEMVERLSRQARKWNGIRYWYLSVLARNDRALKFWHHCGFQEFSADSPIAGYTDAVYNLQRSVKAKLVCQHARVGGSETMTGAART